MYFTKEITPESLVSIYEALGVKAEGKCVAVKSPQIFKIKIKSHTRAHKKQKYIAKYLQDSDIMPNFAVFIPGSL